jgi:NitT/TauT family transport system substrate-binding protein/putative hydroxymethylpyrimidine transport system substrate-binding protein
MRWLAAPLAAVLFAVAVAGCGGNGAEPGASKEATLVLDFQPNAVHAGIYAALADGAFEDAGVDLTIREPSSSTDAPKLLETRRAAFAVLDIHDLGLARERGLDVVGLAAIVQRPLAAVIAADAEAVARPGDLEGATVGVTGLPSDDAVLDAVLESGGLEPDDAERVTIGFDSIAALSSRRVDAATAFWNAEGVVLRNLGVHTRELRVDDYGAPSYPELVLATSAETLDRYPDQVDGVVGALAQGYGTVVDDPDRALDDLLAAVPELDGDEQRDQLDALLAAGAFTPPAELSRPVLERWAAWDLEHGILSRPLDVGSAFALE